MSNNLKYLTETYPEGDVMLDLFVHPLDYVTFLFGKEEVNISFLPNKNMEIELK